MKFDRAQLDAVGEVLNIAFGRSVAALSDPLSMRLVRKESLCDVLDEHMLRISLAQYVGSSGDVALCTLSGQLSAVVAIVFKKTSGFKLVNARAGRPLDDIPASADAAAEELRVMGSVALAALAASLTQQLRAEVAPDQPRLVRCHEACDALLESIPPTLSRRTRDLVLISHALTTDTAAIQAEVLCIADCAGFSPFLRSCRLAA
jgi:chemotaxis protein CheY-P-specific phosphatase CheC